MEVQTDIRASLLIRLRVSLKNIVAILNIPADSAPTGCDVCRVNVRRTATAIRLKADQPITHESIWSNGIGPSENCINGRSVQKEVVRACRRSRRQTSIFIANLNFEHPVRNEAIELAVTVIRKSLKSALNIRSFRIAREPEWVSALMTVANFSI